VNSGRTRTNRPDHRHKSCTWKPLLDLVLTTLLKMFIELLEDSSQRIRCADRPPILAAGQNEKKMV
jgi:hypothetical protein